MNETERLKAAQDAVKALIEEYFVVLELGYGEPEQEQYHAQHWNALLEALQITDLFCSVCGKWFSRGKDCLCFEENKDLGYLHAEQETDQAAIRYYGD